MGKNGLFDCLCQSWPACHPTHSRAAKVQGTDVGSRVDAQMILGHVHLGGVVVNTTRGGRSSVTKALGS